MNKLISFVSNRFFDSIYQPPRQMYSISFQMSWEVWNVYGHPTVKLDEMLVLYGFGTSGAMERKSPYDQKGAFTIISNCTPQSDSDKLISAQIDPDSPPHTVVISCYLLLHTDKYNRRIEVFCCDGCDNNSCIGH